MWQPAPGMYVLLTWLFFRSNSFSLCHHVYNLSLYIGLLFHWASKCGCKKKLLSFSDSAHPNHMSYNITKAVKSSLEKTFKTQINFHIFDPCWWFCASPSMKTTKYWETNKSEYYCFSECLFVCLFVLCIISSSHIQPYLAHSIVTCDVFMWNGFLRLLRRFFHEILHFRPEKNS